MNPTKLALLSRNMPNVIVENLIAKKLTLAKLGRKLDAELAALRLLPKHIDAIRDTKRPPIPVAILSRVLEESWRTYCVCHRPGRPFVVHHIEEWGKGGTHDEHNLAVLCLDDHDEAHLEGGLSVRLPARFIAEAKRKWIVRSRRLRDTYEKQLISAHNRSARWYWIHVANLQAKIKKASDLGVSLGEERMSMLRANHFIDHDGNINPEAMWRETLCRFPPTTNGG